MTKGLALVTGYYEPAGFVRNRKLTYRLAEAGEEPDVFVPATAVDDVSGNRVWSELGDAEDPMTESGCTVTTVGGTSYDVVATVTAVREALA